MGVGSSQPAQAKLPEWIDVPGGSGNIRFSLCYVSLTDIHDITHYHSARVNDVVFNETRVSAKHEGSCRGNQNIPWCFLDADVFAALARRVPGAVASSTRVDTARFVLDNNMSEGAHVLRYGTSKGSVYANQKNDFQILREANGCTGDNVCGQYVWQNGKAVVRQMRTSQM
ncbi:MAG: hypothetical protein CMA10_04585 [Euryarchaeota archaeon]|nr:hypothetical protein [Euryarchaeota archaeon]